MPSLLEPCHNSLQASLLWHIAKLMSGLLQAKIMSHSNLVNLKGTLQINTSINQSIIKNIKSPVLGVILYVQIKTKMSSISNVQDRMFTYIQGIIIII